MPEQAQVEESGIAPAFRETTIAGGAAGAHTVTGIEPHHRLAFVLEHDPDAGGAGVGDIISRTSDFSISDTDEIDNTGGVDSTGHTLWVGWWEVPVE